MTPFGMRAMMSLRLDKFFGVCQLAFGPDYTAADTGLDRFISFRIEVDFIARGVADAGRAKGKARKPVAFEVDAIDADVQGVEPIWLDGSVIGFCTSGRYSHCAEKSVAQRFVPVAQANEEMEVEIDILGRMRPANLVTTPLFDAGGAGMRG